MMGDGHAIDEMSMGNDFHSKIIVVMTFDLRNIYMYCEMPMNLFGWPKIIPLRSK